MGIVSNSTVTSWLRDEDLLGETTATINFALFVFARTWMDANDRRTLVMTGVALAGFDDADQEFFYTCQIRSVA